MSGLVYVCDVRRRPLMPTSAAYTRTLVQQKKAVLLPHPAVPLLQLTHTVPEPALRPVLLGMAVHLTTATAVVFTETLGATPLLSLTLDIQTITSISQRTTALTMLARTLGTLLPISQGALLVHPSVASDTTNTSAPHTVASSLEKRLSYPITLLSREAPLPINDPLLYRFQQQIGDSYSGTTVLAAAYMPHHQTAQHSSIEPSQAAWLQGENHHDLMPGMVVQVQQDEEKITGIVESAERSDAVKLWVPIEALEAGVSWVDVHVSPPFYGWRWEAQPVTLLQVASQRKNRGI
jgi:hypothetical protein